MENLLLYLNKIASAAGAPISEECLNYLRKVVKYTVLKKDIHLLVPGNVCRNLYFIRKGFLKCYYFLPNGKEVCDWLLGENEAVVSIESFYDQVPTNDYIQAMEDCELFYISFDDLCYLYDTFQEFNVLGRVLTIRYLRLWHQHERGLKMLTAEQRFSLLMKNSPDLVKRVPVKDLASYLDMSRETLSRVRGRIN